MGPGAFAGKQLASKARMGAHSLTGILPSPPRAGVWALTLVHVSVVCLCQGGMMRGAATGAAVGSLSPHLPLMELFWRTLLPWNRVDPRTR